ncbi:HlyD family type I secretion periplasmic adaptor subunit [Parasphingorhabdus cellanae]|uniref:Membrane fusion protein (MFP) family protein n=1 Tax=Parasphingorhabdus cellanae TaxID=2806553 RepID=A0ABX7T8F4_9SPHN|nr:HlyD family type I secretion periplasmic adaptor subunit [Parasphingorhabdus cellanae]QTD57183.1 HlyD family type I secretion periplasmic adaptor subunit [Parasphingorhabdus cellanae]
MSEEQASAEDAAVKEGFFARRFPGLARHWMILRESWAQQNVADDNAKPQSDHEFLPAALEIMEKPASPGLRWLMLILCSLFAIALLWSFIGKVDVVATATGKVVPSASSKVIQPIEIGSIRAIHVKNGQRVKKGQLLVELDSTISNADAAQSSQQLMSAEIVRARNDALMAHLKGLNAQFVPPAGTPTDVALTQTQFVRSAIGEYEAEKASLEQQRAERQAQLIGAQAEIAKLEQTLPLLDRQLAARQELAEKGYFSRLRLLEFEQLRVEHIQNIEVQHANAAQARASIGNLDAQITRLRQAFGRGAVSEMAEAEDRSAMAVSELRKAAKRREFQQIRSPVDGTVQQLTLTTIGGVVQPAEPIMVIVPNDAEVQVSAQILNKDIGFIYEGQPVRVKLEAFNFTDYGLIEGVVDNISRDAIQDENLGLVYAARIKLNKRHLMVGGRRQAIGPGLQVQAEIKTGERRIIQYLLSPIAKTMDEAGRER